jgi:hypothetical protein
MRLGVGRVHLVVKLLRMTRMSMDLVRIDKTLMQPRISLENRHPISVKSVVVHPVKVKRLLHPGVGSHFFPLIHPGSLSSFSFLSSEHYLSPIENLHSRASEMQSRWQLDGRSSQQDIFCVNVGV